MAAFAIFIGLYPFRYFLVDRKFGLLQLKTDEVLTSLFWNIGFYSHIVPGGIALLIGWLQFNRNIRTKSLTWHRTIGKIYVLAALISSLAAIYISLYATGGIITSLGFICLGLFWFFSTYKAYSSIRNRNIDTHREMMIYSYAACMAAVTLRLWLPFFSFLFHDFNKAYLLVAWVSWIPNLAIAYFIIRRQRVTASIALP